MKTLSMNTIVVGKNTQMKMKTYMNMISTTPTNQNPREREESQRHSLKSLKISTKFDKNVVITLQISKSLIQQK